MKLLYDEILHRFPEVKTSVFDGDEELPYVVIGYVTDWLRKVAKPAFEPHVIQRVIEFDRWCMSQPEGRDASDDIPTIAMVGFREQLFEHDELLPLIPHVMQRGELLRNKDYLSNWVGADRYESALKLFRDR